MFTIKFSNFPPNPKIIGVDKASLGIHFISALLSACNMPHDLLVLNRPFTDAMSPDERELIKRICTSGMNVLLTSNRSTTPDSTLWAIPESPHFSTSDGAGAGQSLVFSGLKSKLTVKGVDRTDAGGKLIHGLKSASLFNPDVIVINQLFADYLHQEELKYVEKLSTLGINILLTTNLFASPDGITWVGAEKKASRPKHVRNMSVLTA